MVDKVLGQCGEVGGRYGGIAGRSFEAGCRLAADPMHPSTACMVGSAVAQSDVRRRPGWRCALTASSTDGNGGALGTGGASTGGRGEGDPSPSLHLSSTASHPLVLVLCPGDSHQQCPQLSEPKLELPGSHTRLQGLNILEARVNSTSSTKHLASTYIDARQSDSTTSRPLDESGPVSPLYSPRSLDLPPAGPGP